MYRSLQNNINNFHCQFQPSTKSFALLRILLIISKNLCYHYNITFLYYNAVFEIPFIIVNKTVKIPIMVKNRHMFAIYPTGSGSSEFSSFLTKPNDECKRVRSSNCSIERPLPCRSPCCEFRTRKSATTDVRATRRREKRFRGICNCRHWHH